MSECELSPGATNKVQMETVSVLDFSSLLLPYTDNKALNIFCSPLVLFVLFEDTQLEPDTKSRSFIWQSLLVSGLHQTQSHAHSTRGMYYKTLLISFFTE